MKELVLVLAAVAAALGLGYVVYKLSQGTPLDEIDDEATEDIKKIDDVLDSVQKDIREAISEIDDLLDQTDVDERIAEQLEDVRQFAEENIGDKSPSVLIEEAVNAGDRFGRRFPDHIEDLEKEIRDVHGELSDLSEFLRTFFETAKASAELELDKKLPKEGEDRFPHIGYLESAGVETYRDLLEYSDDFTEIKQIGPSRAEDIEDRLREDGFDV